MLDPLTCLRMMMPDELSGLPCTTAEQLIHVSGLVAEARTAAKLTGCVWFCWRAAASETVSGLACIVNELEWEPAS